MCDRTARSRTSNSHGRSCSMNKRGLGRGLDALLSSTPAPDKGESLVEIAIDQIEPNPLQPRKTFAPEPLADLAKSIRASGVIQPIVVRRVGGAYQLIAGERRWRAAREAGLATGHAVVRDASDVAGLWIGPCGNR